MQLEATVAWYYRKIACGEIQGRHVEVGDSGRVGQRTVHDRLHVGKREPGYSWQHRYSGY